MSEDHDHEDDRAARAFRAALSSRADAYEPVPTTVPRHSRRWLVPVGVAAGVAAVALAVTWVLAPGGPADPPATAAPAPTPTGEPPFLVDADGQPLLGCWGREPAFSPAAMDGALNDTVTRADALDALVTLPTSLRAGSLDEVEYRVLSRWTEGASEHLLLGIGPWSSTNDDPVADLEAWTVRRDGDGWESRGGGSCRPSTVGREGGLVSIDVLEATPSLSASGEVAAVAVSELECTSGRDPRPFLRSPWFVETDEAITVYWAVEPSRGGTCIGTLPVETELELPSPLGDRVLLDGSVWPPQQVLP